MAMTDDLMPSVAALEREAAVLEAVLDPVVRASGPQTWQGPAADQFARELDARRRRLRAVAGDLRAGARRPLAPRGPDADVRMGAPGISGRHAAVSVRADGAVRVEDLRSHLGLRLNSRPLAGATTVSADDRLSFGPVPARCVRPWPAADRQKSAGDVS